MATIYKIHPAIGIGRVGSSQDYYIAPSTAGAAPTEYSSSAAQRNNNVFRDAQNKLLRQAVRFQVFAYDSTNPDDLGHPVTVGQGGVLRITWKVWLASKKASWYQFMQHTGSGMGPYDASDSASGYAFSNDAGYETNNQNNPWNPTAHNHQDPARPANPIRFNQKLGTSPNPATLGDPIRKQLILDPGLRSVTGPGQSANFDLDPTKYLFLKSLSPFPITTLGSMTTDAGSNLIVLPGFGNSGTTDLPVKIDAYANNNGWFDDIADGPVMAEITLASGGSPIEAANGWFSSAPPKYAPEAINIVTMYENMYDLFVRERGYNPALFRSGAFDPNYTPSFPDEVLPILARPTVYQWFTEMPVSGRTPHSNLLPNGNPGDPGYAASVKTLADGFAENAFPYVRGRGQQNGSPAPAENQPGLMPKLAGDNPISNFTISKFLGLTQTQFFILSQFADGKYTLGAQATLPRGASGPGPQLDRAHLENAVGGPFTPGIEITWISRNLSIYRLNPPPAVASDWFRIFARPIHTIFGPPELSLTNGSNNDYTQRGVEPGDLTKYMAQPWQADFNECSNQSINPVPGSNNTDPSGSQVTLWWWPVQRPWVIVPSVNNPTFQHLNWTRGFKHPEEEGNTQQDLQMVTNWRDLGFIKKQTVPAGTNNPLFQEIERNTANINSYQPPPGS